MSRDIVGQGKQRDRPAAGVARLSSPITGLLETDLILEPEALERLRGEWDALALACELPLMCPAWLLAWWRHIAPKPARLRVVAVREGGKLVGLAPFYESPRRDGRIDYRLLGNGLGSPLAPLALPRLQLEVASALGRALTRAHPRPDLIALHSTPLASGWHAALGNGWTGRFKPISIVYRTRPYPTVWLQGKSCETWLAGRSSKFRSKMRRLERRFDEAGGSWRMSTEATLPRDIELFRQLHAARWQGRGNSTVVAYGQRIHDMLSEAGLALIADERFRLWVMEVAGEAIAANIYVCGGGIAVGINGGWDERWKRLSPPLLATMHAIEDSIAREERRLDMGSGAGSHKTRFSDGESPVAWAVLLTPGRRLARTLALTAPMLAGSAVGNLARRVLNPEQVRTLRALRASASRSSRGAPTPPPTSGACERAFWPTRRSGEDVRQLLR
jgi:CelD/BcsL family acetyltransferase involved in cellulose biosynthesis